MDDSEILRNRMFARWYMRFLRGAKNKWRDKAVELRKKVEQLEFFYEGNGFKKRGLNNSIQIADYIEKLEKENTGLKEKKIKGCYFGKDELGNDFFAKCDCVDCQKRTIALLDLRKEYLNKINKEKVNNDQLTKATELIKKFVKWGDYEGPDCPKFNDIKAEAESFLKEIKEK